MNKNEEIDSLIKKIETDFHSEILVLTTDRIKTEINYFWPLFSILTVGITFYAFFEKSFLFVTLGLSLALLVSIILNYFSFYLTFLDKEEMRNKFLNLCRIEALKLGFFHLQFHQGICLGFSQKEKKMIILADSRYQKISLETWLTLRKSIEKNWDSLDKSILDAVLGVQEILKNNSQNFETIYTRSLDNAPQTLREGE